MSTNKSNLRENSKRLDYDYAVGQQVYIVCNKPYCKIEGPKMGPYQITEVFTNGNVRIQQGSVNKRINTRRLESHFE